LMEEVPPEICKGKPLKNIIIGANRRVAYMILCNVSSVRT
jgi:hypothetical protein